MKLDWMRSLMLATCLIAAAAPARAEDTHAFPNPFVAKNSSTGKISFTPLPSSGTIKIYTVDGVEIQSLDINDGLVDWNTKNSSGKNVATGVYYFRVNGDNTETIGKLVIIR
jgi:hypothetical protein